LPPPFRPAGLRSCSRPCEAGLYIAIWCGVDGIVHAALNRFSTKLRYLWISLLLDPEEHHQQQHRLPGRPSRDIKLEELTLPECNQFWPRQSRVSLYEKLKILSVTGGVPRYLDLVDTRRSAEDNFRQILFSKNSVLLNEFDFVFSDTVGPRIGSETTSFVSTCDMSRPTNLESRRDCSTDDRYLPSPAGKVCWPSSSRPWY
jgi:hypothetical protein